MSGRTAKRTRRLERGTPETAAILAELARVSPAERRLRLAENRTCGCYLIPGQHAETEDCRRTGRLFLEWLKEKLKP